MDRISISSAREEFADALNRVAYGGERIILERRGKNIAGLVSVDDVKFLQRLEDEYDLSEARKALSEAEIKGTISWEQIKKEMAKRRKRKPAKSRRKSA